VNIEHSSLMGTTADMSNKELQQPQLSQRDRAMLRVIEYFAESLKVIRNDSLE